MLLESGIFQTATNVILVRLGLGDSKFETIGVDELNFVFLRNARCHSQLVRSLCVAEAALPVLWTDGHSCAHETA